MFWKKKKPIQKQITVGCEKCSGSGRLTRDIHKWTIPANRHDPTAFNCSKCKGTGVEKIWIDA